jgi:hypothetical protein
MLIDYQRFTVVQIFKDQQVHHSHNRGAMVDNPTAKELAYLVINALLIENINRYY